MGQWPYYGVRVNLQMGFTLNDGRNGPFRFDIRYIEAVREYDVHNYTEYLPDRRDEHSKQLGLTSMGEQLAGEGKEREEEEENMPFLIERSEEKKE